MNEEVSHDMTGEADGMNQVVVNDRSVIFNDEMVKGRERVTQLTTWCQGHVLNWGREHSAFPVHWSGILSLSHCGLSIVSQLFVAGLRLTFLTSTYRDFIFTLLVFSIIVDIKFVLPGRPGLL